MDLDNREPYANSIPLPYCHLHTTDHSSSTLVYMYKVAWAMMPELARLCKLIHSLSSATLNWAWELVGGHINSTVYFSTCNHLLCLFLYTTTRTATDLRSPRDEKILCLDWQHIKVQEMLRQESKGANSEGQSH